MHIKPVVNLIHCEFGDFGDDFDRKNHLSVIVRGAIAPPKPQVVQSLAVQVRVAPPPGRPRHRARKYALCGG